MFSALGRGMLAGAAGTTALNAVTFLDMGVRARPASETPQQAVDILAERAGHPVPGEGADKEHRLVGLGSLSGLATGVAVGAVAGLLGPVLRQLPRGLPAVLLGGGVMAATNTSLVRLRLTDPSSWSVSDWLSDLVPHLAYGAVTEAGLRATGH